MLLLAALPYSAMRALPRIATLVAAAIVAATTSAAPQYQIFDLGVVQMNDLDSHGNGVSAAGIAVGHSGTGNGGQAFTWTQGSGLMGLPLLSGRDSSVAFSANDNGIIVGRAFNETVGGSTLPVIWQNGVVSQLPLPAGFAVGQVFAVNASGIAVGSAGEGGEWEHAAIYTVGGSSVITATPPNGSQFSAAYGINDSGRIVGVGFLPSNPAIQAGIVYDLPTNTIFDVGTLPGANTAMALAVNNNGQVVGSSDRQPYIWTEGSGMVAIPLLPGKDRGDAQGVNSAGWVVGTDWLVNSSYAPFLYDGTTTYRLSDLLPPGSGWVLNGYSSLNINDNAIIVGTGVHNGETHAYAMVPVTGTPTPAPTPSTTPLPTATPSTTPNEPHFEVSAPVVVLPGVPFDITVTAKLFNSVLTGYTGTVHFTSTASSGAHLPPDSTLTNGVGTFSVTFDTPGNYTITARDTVNPSMIGTSGTIFVAVIDPPTPTIGPTATPGVSPTPSPTPTLTPTPPPNPTPTPSATASPTPPTQALNLSTRLRVQTGDNVGVGGFIITGTGPKHVLLRAIGPSLTASGVPNALADPVLELHGPSPFVTISDDDWRDDPAQEALIIASGIQPTNDLESAIDATLDPGIYTAIIKGKNDTSGVGLVELYDLSQAAPSKLANISTRAFVSTGDSIVIGGFTLGGGNANDRVALRGIGPSLTAQGVPNALADPVLELRDGNGALLISNNDWQDDPVQAAELTDAGLAPTNPLESGIATTLPPGTYTALLAGIDNGSGVGLVEVYDRGATP